MSSPLGTIQRINNIIDDIRKDMETTQALAQQLVDKASVARQELDKVFPKEQHYQEVKAQYDVLAPLIEAGIDVDDIDEAMAPYFGQSEANLEKVDLVSLEI